MPTIKKKKLKTAGLAEKPELKTLQELFEYIDQAVSNQIKGLTLREHRKSDDSLTIIYWPAADAHFAVRIDAKLESRPEYHFAATIPGKKKVYRTTGELIEGVKELIGGIFDHFADRFGLYSRKYQLRKRKADKPANSDS